MYVLQIITSREREQIKHTHTLLTDPRWRKRKNKNLQKQTKAHICNVTGERLSSRRRRRGRRLVKYRITLRVTEKEREIVRESEEECLCVTIY